MWAKKNQLASASGEREGLAWKVKVEVEMEVKVKVKVEVEVEVEVEVRTSYLCSSKAPLLRVWQEG